MTLLSLYQKPAKYFLQHVHSHMLPGPRS